MDMGAGIRDEAHRGDTWGWLAIVVAGAQVITALLLVLRWIGGTLLAIVVTMGGVLLNFLILGARPAWAAVGIVCNLLVLWAVTVHGEEFTRD
jgi:hypothetical protein